MDKSAGVGELRARDESLVGDVALKGHSMALPLKGQQDVLGEDHGITSVGGDLQKPELPHGGASHRCL